MQLYKGKGACALVLSSILLAASCGGGGGGGGPTKFAPKSTRQATAGALTPVLSGRWLAYLADEATSGPSGGTNFNAANGDTDKSDAIAFVVDMQSGTELNLFTAVESIEILGNQIYLIVRESADSKDWDMDGAPNDIVLLHWSTFFGAVAYVDTLVFDATSMDAAGPLAAVNTRVYYTAALSTPPGAGETALRFVSESAPRFHSSVLHAVAAAAGSPLTPTILDQDEGLLFLSLDENAEGIELNADGLVDDGFVLALLDTTDPSAMVLNVGRAVADAATPLRARRLAAGDWNVAFLVSEAAQDDFPSGLNDAALFSASWLPFCNPAYSDTDTADDVLHFLGFNAWSANPGGNPPINTGLAGAGRVLSVPGWVATLAPESDDGNCSTNGDADTSDIVLRWASTAAPYLPVTNNSRLLALANTPGGTQGATDLDGFWIAVVDEAADDRDHDQDGKKDRTLVAWLDPQNSAPWTFDHGTGPGLQSVGVSWMAERPQRDSVLCAFQESVFGLSVNSNGDADILDSIPAFAEFEGGNDLDFLVPAIALDSGNPGMVLAGGVVFYRVDETEDNRDWNGDGDLDDQILWRTQRANLSSNEMGTLNSLPGAAAVIASDFGAAYVADEGMADRDFNNDGDKADFVVRWFRI